MVGLAHFLGIYFPELFKTVKRQAEVDPRIIMATNGTVSIVYAVLVVAAGLSTNIFDVMVKAAAVFATGSLFDLLKAYGAIYKEK